MEDTELDPGTKYLIKATHSFGEILTKNAGYPALLA
jgi:hypothetical protein